MCRRAVEDYEGKPVASITFEPNLIPFSASELAEIVLLKKGEPLRLTDVRASIERLFATGRYDDIVVDARLENGQVAITFLTKGNWFVGQVAVQGASAPPSGGQLVNATDLDLGTLFREESLAVVDLEPEEVDGQQRAVRTGHMPHASRTKTESSRRTYNSRSFPDGARGSARR